MARINHDVSNKNCLSLLNHRDVGMFKVLSITKLANIFEPLTGIGKKVYYYLLFSFYHIIYT